jgi:hypothetical protein
MKFKKNDWIKYKPEHADLGDDEISFRCAEDESGGRVLVMACLGLPINPSQVVKTAWLEHDVERAIEELEGVTQGEPITTITDVDAVRSDLEKGRREFTEDEYPESVHESRLRALEIVSGVIASGCTCHHPQGNSPVPNHCPIHDGDYSSFLVMNNCD